MGILSSAGWYTKRCRWGIVVLLLALPATASWSRDSGGGASEPGGKFAANRSSAAIGALARSIRSGFAPDVRLGALVGGERRRGAPERAGSPCAGLSPTSSRCARAQDFAGSDARPGH